MPRLRHWARRLGLVLLELFAVLTIVSLVYNAATADRVKPATALYAGPFVRVDGKAVAYRRWGTHGTPIILLGGFLATSSDWIFRRALAGAYPHHPSFTREFLEEWERPFKLEGTLDAFRTMLQYGIQGFQLSQLRTVRVPALVLWGTQDTVDSVPSGRKSARALRAPFLPLAGAGHLSMLAAPNAIAREVDSFARH